MNPEPPLPTSAEIDRRFRIVSEMRNLCLSLGRARWLDDGEEAASGEADPAEPHSPLAAPEIPR